MQRIPPSNQPNLFTPLHIASAAEKLAISTSILIKTEIEVEAKDLEADKSPLSIVQETDFEGNTPLHIAATNGCCKNLISLLFRGNADVKAQNNKGI